MVTFSSFLEAADCLDMEQFTEIVLPAEWRGLRARLLESGVTFGPKEGYWAARWTPVPLTVKSAQNKDHAKLKSIIYRTHDCFHQMWGLPHPVTFSHEEHNYFKRVIMCGEIAVLMITEFIYCDWIYKHFPEAREWLDLRNALPLKRGPLAGRSPQQIAARLDGLLHRKIRAAWVRESETATKFANDYEPMLQRDRELIDINWELMKQNKWFPEGAPQSRALVELDGLELTMWMIQDFEHTLTTSPLVDKALRDFNVKRRSVITLPKGWNAT